jgi:hypothetical protein
VRACVRARRVRIGVLVLLTRSKKSGQAPLARGTWTTPQSMSSPASPHCREGTRAARQSKVFSPGLWAVRDLQHQAEADCSHASVCVRRHKYSPGRVGAGRGNPRRVNPPFRRSSRATAPTRQVGPRTRLFLRSVAAGAALRAIVMRGVLSFGLELAGHGRKIWGTGRAIRRFVCRGPVRLSPPSGADRRLLPARWSRSAPTSRT